MSESKFDVLAIGNAMVDVLVHVDDSVIAANGMAKDAMTLIDADRAAELYASMPPAVEASGGSAANTAVGVAMLGGRAAYIGKVSEDQLGEVFRHDIRAAGVSYGSRPADNSATGRCLIFITPDAHRTMNTFLGAGSDLGPEDVDDDIVRSAKVTYLEGYLWDSPRAKAAFLHAARTAHDAGRKLALTLSDPFCVERHREEFLELAADHTDILFANEAEILSLYQVSNFDDALQRVRADCEIAALTRSERGSVIVSHDEVHVIDAERIGRVIDTTGAGDLYAAGFLYGYTQGLGLATCGRIAGIAAAEVISHFGARPQASLSELIRGKIS